MKIKGLQKLTLLDYPGHTACTVFTYGCNFRCPFCHNASLVVKRDNQDDTEISEQEFFDFLKKRQGLLDGVCVTGGEPTLQKDLIEFLEKIKDLGYLVKLDTNGYNPEVLGDTLDKGLCDYVAMDIKTSPENYDKVSGVKDLHVDKIIESIKLIRDSKIDYEFRTTVVENLHDENDFESIGKILDENDKYYLQFFVDSGDCIENNFTAAPKDVMAKYLTAVKKYAPKSKLRGI